MEEEGEGGREGGKGGGRGKGPTLPSWLSVCGLALCFYARGISLSSFLSPFSSSSLPPSFLPSLPPSLRSFFLWNVRGKDYKVTKEDFKERDKVREGGREGRREKWAQSEFLSSKS